MGTFLLSLPPLAEADTIMLRPGWVGYLHDNFAAVLRGVLAVNPGACHSGGNTEQRTNLPNRWHGYRWNNRHAGSCYRVEDIY